MNTISEKSTNLNGIGCVSCPYGPGNFEEYAIAQKAPTEYCPDAYSERAQYCGMYNKNTGNSLNPIVDNVDN